MAGKRGGEKDEKGILFYNSHEFIQKNKPRFFCFENVEGLLSDDGGKTFAKWVDLLGGKSVNGNPVIFPHENSVPYHIYYKVINALDHNIPQNRKRIFIVGVRNDQDNRFKWKKEQNLSRFLKDVVEKEVDSKYFLSEKVLDFYKRHEKKHRELGNGFSFKTKDLNSYACCLRAKTPDAITDNFIKQENKDCLKIKSATKCGYEIARLNEDSINFEHPKSETRRGRVGKGFAQTLTTSCNQGVAESREKIRRLTPLECFRLMDFNPDFKWDVSDSQAYKQAGNSICVGVLAGIIESITKIINETQSIH